MIRQTLLAASLLLTAASLFAQTPDHLVGVTRMAPSLRHQDHWACAPIGQCPLPWFPNAAGLPPHAGGTGWDPTRSGAWITNGLVLGKSDDNCGIQCPPVAFPGLGPNAFATGLEVVESQNQLWMIDSLGILHFYNLGCPVVPAGQCPTGLVPGAIQQCTSGLAVDECNGLVFISYPDFATGANWVIVSNIAMPCMPVQRFLVPNCLPVGLGPITGLAVNGCRGLLYATDGVATVALQYVPAAPAVAIINQFCCPGPATLDPMIGLAVRPGRATPMPATCANGSCPPCPMTFDLRGDPNLGNATFGFRLGNAPANQLAWAVVGTGPCSAPGLMTPLLCGPIFAVPILGTLGPNFTGGTVGCTGGTVFPMPLPMIPALCGAVLSAQSLVFCGGATTTAVGTAISDCLSFQIQCN